MEIKFEALTGYNISVQTYNQAAQVDVVQKCNGWTATNLGDANAEINGISLLAGVPGTVKGDSISIGGNFGEVYQGNLRLVFTPGGAAPLVEIIQKFYT